MGAVIGDFAEYPTGDGLTKGAASPINSQEIFDVSRFSIFKWVKEGCINRHSTSLGTCLHQNGC